MLLLHFSWYSICTFYIFPFFNFFNYCFFLILTPPPERRPAAQHRISDVSVNSSRSHHKAWLPWNVLPSPTWHPWLQIQLRTCNAIKPNCFDVRVNHFSEKEIASIRASWSLLLSDDNSILRINSDHHLALMVVLVSISSLW